MNDPSFGRSDADQISSCRYWLNGQRFQWIIRHLGADHLPVWRQGPGEVMTTAQSRALSIGHRLSSEIQPDGA